MLHNYSNFQIGMFSSNFHHQGYYGTTWKWSCHVRHIDMIVWITGMSKFFHYIRFYWYHGKKWGVVGGGGGAWGGGGGNHFI